MCKLISTPASLLTRQGTAVYPKGQSNTDQSRSKVRADHPCYRDEVAQQLFKIEIIMRPGSAKLHRPYIAAGLHPALPRRFSQAREAVHEAGRSHD